MTYINFITGLIIAAVLSVPGAMQHEATQVEEELVVENTNAEVTLQEAWFVYNLTSKDREDVEDPANYTLNPAGGNVEPDCNGLNELCAIRASNNSGQPDLSDNSFVDEIMDILDDPLTHSSPRVKLEP